MMISPTRPWNLGLLERSHLRQQENDAWIWNGGGHKITDEEERLNLVSHLLTSKVTVSVLNIAWHWYTNPNFVVIKTSVTTYYPWLGCMSALAHMYVSWSLVNYTCPLPPPPHIHTCTYIRWWRRHHLWTCQEHVYGREVLAFDLSFL